MLGSRSLDQYWVAVLNQISFLPHTDHSSARCTGCKNPAHVILPASPAVMTPSATLPAKADNGWASSALAASPRSTFLAPMPPVAAVLDYIV